MIKWYIPSVFRDNLSTKSIPASLLPWKWCKKYGETLHFPSKIRRHREPVVLPTWFNLQIHTNTSYLVYSCNKQEYIIFFKFDPYPRPLYCWQRIHEAIALKKFEAITIQLLTICIFRISIFRRRVWKLILSIRKAVAAVRDIGQPLATGGVYVSVLRASFVSPAALQNICQV